MTTTENRCPNGHPVDPANTFCQECGARASATPAGSTCPFGHAVEPGRAFCSTCGASVATAVPGTSSFPPPAYGPPPTYGAPGPGANPYYPIQYGYVQPRSTNGLAIASLVCSIAGLALCGVPSLVGLILGIFALNQLKTRDQEGRGLAIAGIVVGSIVVVGILAYILFVFVLLAGVSTSSSSSNFNNGFNNAIQTLALLRAR